MRQTRFANGKGIGKRLLAMAMVAALAVGIALPIGSLSFNEAWGQGYHPGGNPSQPEGGSGSSGSDDYVYWRFKGSESSYDDEKKGSADLSELAAHVRVTASKQNETGIHTIPYGSVSKNPSTVTLPEGSASVDQDDIGSYIYIETDEGYVVTSYMIGCEFGSGHGSSGGQYAEGCQTAATSNLEVVLSADGKYRSQLTIDEQTYKGESNTTDGFWGHGSEGMGSGHHYALLITVAKVNVDLTVDKKADRESISTDVDETINYTVTAATTNDLVNPQFEDAFLKDDNTSNVSVSLVDSAGVKTALAKAASKTEIETASSESQLPSKYYIDKTSGKVFLNGRWTKGHSLEMAYTYKVTANSIDPGTTTKITNTAWVQGTKTGTESSVNDYGVASVDVLVNDPGRASLRVSKTFVGLSYDDVYGTPGEGDSAARSGGVIDGFYMLVEGASGNSNYLMSMNSNIKKDGYETVQMKYSQSDSGNGNYSFYGDLINVDPNSVFKVTECGYWPDSLKSSYGVCTTSSSWQIGEGSVGASTTSGTSDAISNVKLGKGATTFVDFVNTYATQATPASASISVEKNLTGRDWKDGESFEFTLEAVTPNAPMPSEGGETVTVTNSTAGHTASFGSITYAAPGTYQYKISEDKGGTTVDGITYADPQTVTVTVADDGEGALRATVGYPDGKSAFVFTNTYSAEGTLGGDDPAAVKIAATKTLNGRDLKDGEFSFVVKNAGGSEVATGTNDLEGNIKFKEIEYDTAKVQKDVEERNASVAADGSYEYRYTVSEVDAGLADKGVTATASTFSIAVRLTDDGNGRLTPVVVYPEGASSLGFVNTYGADGGTSLVISGSKILEADEGLTPPGIAGKYTFTLKDSSGKVISTKSNDPTGDISFDSINYTMADLSDGATVNENGSRTKVLTYTVTESGSVEGVTNDSTSSKTVEVTLTDDGKGHLTAVASPASFSFTNAYSVEPESSSLTGDPDGAGEGHVPVTKKLTGRDLVDGEFEFQLTDADGKVVAEGSNDADGKVSMDPVTFSKPGTYHYTLSEVKGNAESVTYDASEYEVTAEVTDDGDGTMSVFWSAVSESQPNGIKEIVFKNSYEVEEVAPPVTPDPGTDNEPEPEPESPAVSDDSDDKEPVLAKTGDGTFLLLVGAGMLAVLAVAVCLFARRKLS